MKVSRFAGILALCLFAIVAAPAMGHPGHSGVGFVTGLMHPLSGVDHLVTMLAIGLWAGQLGKRGIWFVPATFVAFVLIGAGVALAGFHFSPSAVDQSIAASALILGILLAGALRLPVWSGATLAAVFALFNGYAHGAELQPGQSALTFGLGFISTTVVLLLTGIVLAELLTALRNQRAIRMAGVAVALMGILLFTGIL